MWSTSDFFNTLFNAGEYTCFAKDAKGTKVFPVEKFDWARPWAEFFSINPIHPFKDLNPIEEYHSADKPRRADHNVITYRNILIEIDSMALDEQLPWIDSTGLPFSTAVFSGGKSNHFIISLETPVESEEEYRVLVERTYRALGGKGAIDVACRNPSRLSRFPNAYRRDRNKIQEILEIRNRVPLQVLKDWISSKGVPENLTPKREYRPRTEFSSKELPPVVLNFLMHGAQNGSRNSTLFRMACELCRRGYSPEEIIEITLDASGLTYQEASRTIKSATSRTAFDEMRQKSG